MNEDKIPKKKWYKDLAFWYEVGGLILASLCISVIRTCNEEGWLSLERKRDNIVAFEQKDNIVVKFDELARDIAEETNSLLPIKMNEFTTCVSMEYYTEPRREFVIKYMVIKEIESTLSLSTVRLALKDEMVSALQTREMSMALDAMERCNCVLRCDYYDNRGDLLLLSYIITPREIRYGTGKK